MFQKTLLVIIDGWGIGSSGPANAIHTANTPNMDALSKGKYATSLRASGLAVGLPEGVMGNSEVGHLTIGAGRPLMTDVVRINQAMSSNTLSSFPEFVELKQLSTTPKDTIHFIGLMSDASVHSNINHLFSIIDFLLSSNTNNPSICLHLITDGRDTPTTSSLTFIKTVETFLAKHKTKNIKISTLGGRFYYMDRDNRQERINHALASMLNIQVDNISPSLTDLTPTEYIKLSHQKGLTDEFIVPALFKGGRPLQPEDTLFFFNFRPDRMREITTSFSKLNYNIYSMTEYSSDLTNVKVVFKQIVLNNCLSNILSNKGIKQYHIAETEKYAHVTYFFNGRDEKEVKGEKRILIESDKSVKTYDLAPEMKMKEVASKTIEIIETDKETEFIVINFAAPDMVGHTGNFEAAVLACECCDEQIGRVRKSCKENGWNLVVTADHGNAEVMKDEKTGNVVTSHTCNNVPLLVELNGESMEEMEWDDREGSLADVAPTVLGIMGIKEKVQEMTGKSLFKRK